MARSLQDFSGTGRVLPKRGQLQQMTAALRELDAKDGYDTSGSAEYVYVETWPGVVIRSHTTITSPGEGGTGLPVNTPAMYDVLLSYVVQGLTAAPLKFASAGDIDPVNAEGSDDAVRPVTNLAEYSHGTNFLDSGRPVHVFAFVDRGNPQRRRYVMDTSVEYGFWAKTNSVDNIAPYFYGWVEQYDVGGGVLADKPGGRSGTVLVNYAVNALDEGVYGPLKLSVPDVVWMVVSFDTSGLPVWRFYALPTLSVGTYCNTGPNYDDHLNIAKVRFDVDQFFVERDTHTGESDAVQISWNGFTTAHTKAAASSGLGPVDRYCFNEILDWMDANQGDGSNPGTPKPTGATAQKPSGTGLWQFGVYWDISNTRETDYSDCATCSFRADKGATQIAGSVYLDPCAFLPIVKDCTGTSPGTFSCVQTLNFAGFTVTGASGGSGSPGSATITFDLSVTTGGSYLEVEPGATGCGKVLTLCTRTVTPVATTVVTGCDADGNPTTTTIYSLPTGDSLVVLDDCHS